MDPSLNNRLKFHQVLINALGEGYKVYFQPPETLQMTYPCVVYHRRYLDSVKADNIKYLKNTQYQVVLVSRDPDDEAISKLDDIKNSRYISHSVVDGLYHDAFEIYY